MNANLALRRTYQRHPVVGPALVYAFIGAWTVAGGGLGLRFAIGIERWLQRHMPEVPS